MNPYALTPADRAKLFAQGVILSIAPPATAADFAIKRNKHLHREKLTRLEKRAKNPPLCFRAGCMSPAKHYGQGDYYGKLCAKHAAEAAANTRKYSARKRQKEEAP